ncbi:MAG: hypothetical protein ACQR33_03370 [Candidatus Saccharibacteria bacterium]
MKKLVQQLQRDYPEITFVKGTTFRWSPSTSQVLYCESPDESDLWSLLHEVGHATLQHQTYTTDIELLRKEVQAWDAAHLLARHYNIAIDETFVGDCLDSYRDWLYKRSTCPKCSLQGVQETSGQYICINCKHTWVVNSERFCRPYRRST